jgi:hypothetical protein
MSHSPEQFAAWSDFIAEIREIAPDLAMVPDTDPPKLQIQLTEAASNRQVTLNFVQPPDMIIHFDDQGVSASGGTSAFGIEMAKLANGKFDLMRRKRQLTPKELGAAIVHWLQHGTLFKSETH